MDLFNNIFELPPVDQRQMSRGFLRRFFLPWQFTEKSDDTYIYYLCARACFLISGVLLLLNWISLIFQININLYFFKISLPSENFIEAFSYSFPFYTPTLLLVTVIPFYLIKFFYNINPKKVDVMWWYKNISQNTKLSRLRVICIFLFMLTVSTGGLYMAFGAPLFLMSYSAFGDLSSSYVFLLIISILYSIFYSGLPMYTIFSSSVLYRYIGPYSGKLSSSSIRKGEQR